MSGSGNPYAETLDMYTVHAMFRREYALLPGLPLVERHVFAAEWEAMVAAGAAGIPSEGVHGTPTPPRSSAAGLGTPYPGVIVDAGRV